MFRLFPLLSSFFDESRIFLQRITIHISLLLFPPILLIFIRPLISSHLYSYNSYEFDTFISRWQRCQKNAHKLLLLYDSSFLFSLGPRTPGDILTTIFEGREAERPDECNYRNEFHRRGLHGEFHYPIMLTSHCKYSTDRRNM